VHSGGGGGANNNNNAPTLWKHYNSTSNDYVPNIDVEMYWGERINEQKDMFADYPSSKGQEEEEEMTNDIDMFDDLSSLLGIQKALAPSPVSEPSYNEYSTSSVGT